VCGLRWPTNFPRKLLPPCSQNSVNRQCAVAHVFMCHGVSCIPNANKLDLVESSRSQLLAIRSTCTAVRGSCSIRRNMHCVQGSFRIRRASQITTGPTSCPCVWDWCFQSREHMLLPARQNQKYQKHQNYQVEGPLNRPGTMLTHWFGNGKRIYSAAKASFDRRVGGCTEKYTQQSG